MNKLNILSIVNRISEKELIEKKKKYQAPVKTQGLGEGSETPKGGKNVKR